MKSLIVRACVVVLVGLAAWPVMAQTADTAMTPPDELVLEPAGPAVDTEPPVVQYDLNGPRIGVTFLPNGMGSRSQFGWHFENQTSQGARGPRFLVEQVFLIGGVEKSEFIPSGTLLFGVRTPGGFEFGVGPNITLGPSTLATAVVVAAGQTLRYGGIRVPVNVAVAMSQHEHVKAFRVTLITGWATRQPRYGKRSHG